MENRMNKNLLVCAFTALLILVSGFGFSACSSSTTSAPRKEMTAEEKNKLEGFEALDAKKAEYTAIPDKEQLAKEPYLKKKVLFLRFDPDENAESDKWKRNFFGTDKLGSSLYSKDYEKLEFRLANNPDEVGIIALMPECKSVSAGQYGSTAAFQEQCELILVDPELSADVYRQTFTGELDDSKYVSGETSVTARVDGNEIIDFLDKLQEK